MTDLPLRSSFRDPQGFLFTRDGELLRQVNPGYQPDYDALMSSGLYQRLIDAKLLVPHEEIDAPAAEGTAYKILRPQPLPFISYPYEWSFTQLKHAALATLRIQRWALEADLSLKDASAYNVQFHDGRPVFIDTLSFERYREGEPWVAYRQFCQHFLAPLALMGYLDVRLSQLLRVHIDGVPLDLAAQLLPSRTKLNPGLAIHLHAHAASQKKYESSEGKGKKREVGMRGLIGILDSLESAVRRLKWKGQATEWGDYYSDTNYSQSAEDNKRALVTSYLEQVKPSQVWDLGANDGTYSRLAAELGAFTVASDIDPVAVDSNYRRIRKEKTSGLLPLLIDLTNPSPAQGFDHAERMSFAQRGPADCAMALALIHHLAISNNVPLVRLSEAFRRLGNWLILEWVPKEDSQVRRLLATREDVFPTYTRDDCEVAFGTHWEIERREEIGESVRTLYLLKGR